MKYRVKANSALLFVIACYVLYLIKSFNLYAFLGGIALLGIIICFNDLYYGIEGDNLIIYRIIGKKNIRIKDINSIIEPIPVMHRLNPRTGTIAIYSKKKERFHICPDKQYEMVKEIKKLNKKINIDLQVFK